MAQRLFAEASEQVLFQRNDRVEVILNAIKKVKQSAEDKIIESVKPAASDGRKRKSWQQMRLFRSNLPFGVSPS